MGEREREGVYILCCCSNVQNHQFSEEMPRKTRNTMKTKRNEKKNQNANLKGNSGQVIKKHTSLARIMVGKRLSRCFSVLLAHEEKYFLDIIRCVFELV